MERFIDREGMTAMRILVTGGAGFVGSHSIERLLAAGHEAVAFDNLSTGKPENLDGLGVQLVEGDVRDMEALEETLAERFDAVLHLAAVVSVPISVADPIGSHEINTRGTLNVLEAARRNGVRRVVHASSAAVYGELAPPLHEEMLLKPLSPYAAQKLQNEIDAGVYARLYGLETVSLRYFNIFGPRQDPKSPYSGVLSIFIDALAEGRQPTIFGDGLQTRDFVYVGDVAQANLLALTNKEPGSSDTPQGFALSPRQGGTTKGAVYNVGTGKETTVLEAYRAIAQAMGVDMEPALGPERGGDIRHSLANISAITEALGYHPETSFADGIRKTVEWAATSRASRV
jgi:UDP-glucose 4-epimerase